MTTILSTKHASLLLAILIIHHLLQANSASIDLDPGTAISGRNRNLRTLPSSPPAPELDRGSDFTFVPPAPSTTVQMHNTARNLRVLRNGSPPAPKVSRARNFRIFPSPTRRPPPPPIPRKRRPPPPPIPPTRRPPPPPIPPTRRPPPPPIPPPPPMVARPPANCNNRPPPPKSS